jgi:hypothetical protein
MLDTDGPVVGEDPAWVVRDFPHVAVGVGEGSGHAAQRGAGRRPYDLPAGLLGLGKYYRDLFGGSNIMCEFYAGRAVAPSSVQSPKTMPPAWKKQTSSSGCSAPSQPIAS